MAKMLGELCVTHFKRFWVNNNAIFTNMKSFVCLSRQ